MSLILDALKRADAERARGTVPDLHAQPLGLGDERSPPHRRDGGRRWSVVGGATVVLVAAAAGIGWWMRSPDAPAPREAAPAAPVATAPDAAPARPVAPAPRAAVVAPAAPAVPAAAVAPPPVAVPVARPAASAASAAPVALAAVPTPAKPPGASPSTAPSGAAPAAAAEPRVLSLAELPEDLRRALPPLRFGGAVNSPNPASRLLIVDGQLLHEGDEAAPGVRIRQIRLRSVVLDFRGARVEVPF